MLIKHLIAATFIVVMSVVALKIFKSYNPSVNPSIWMILLFCFLGYVFSTVIIGIIESLIAYFLKKR